MLTQICKEKTCLSIDDIRQLESVCCQLPLMAELTGNDIFIDCAAVDGGAVVVAQARPFSVNSAYEKSVVGQYALPEKEPAVFRALRLHAPVRDLKAVTQEERTVRQDVIPIRNRDGQCIAVLIQEKDISKNMLQEKKFEQLARSYEDEDPSLRASGREDCGVLALREVHHRVKNSLQLVANLLNLQSRRCCDETAKKILQENVGRVLSIAAIHDILTKDEGDFCKIDSIVLLKQLQKNLQALVAEDSRITISVTGTSASLSSGTASSLALVINELVTNALEHAFTGRETGEIHVSFCAGTLFHTVTVEDNGGGFDVFAPRTNRLGLNIVEATVRDRLRGHLSVHSDCTGSRISFDFKTS